MLDNYLDRTIKVKDIVDTCEYAAKQCSDLSLKALESVGKGESVPSALGAAAYFEQKAEMYRSLIPQVIESILAHGEGE